MGTVFSFDLRDPGDWTAALAEAVARLHEVDAIYSTYREDSVISRLGRGELTLAECPPEVGDVFALCDRVHQDSNGYFSIRPEGESGHLDPSGMVKGWAIEQASEILRRHGSGNHSVNGGGDMQLAGEGSSGKPWRVGISDPLRPGRLAGVIVARDAAVATSGLAERGHHVIDPTTGRAATGLAGLTVVGASLTLVDAYATAALAMGDPARHWIEGLEGYEGFAVRADGTTWQTPGFRAWMG